MSLKLWLRDETKAHERRTPLTPEHAKTLVDSGVELTVEESENRIYPLEQYLNVGCLSAKAHSWKEADSSQVILGLKEIEEPAHNFFHDHIYFAHVFKAQANAAKILEQYRKGGGRLFDLEFLTDASNRRVAAFGHWAGFVGAALSLDRFIQRKLDPQSSYPQLKSYESIDSLLSNISKRLGDLNEKPKVIIIGAKGRCGKGAHDVFAKFDIDCSLWDYEETKKGGPFSEILEHDIFINTVLLSKKIAPFIDHELLKNDHHLSVVGDVSCDPESEFNPIAIYEKHTDWSNPFRKIEGSTIEVLAVDNLPSLLPKESSDDFSSQLLPHLLELHSKKDLPEVFSNALREFNRNLSL